MIPVHTILFGTDLSPYSDYGLALASALARDYKARLIIAHVRDVPTVPLGEFGMPPPEGEDREEARKRLYALKPTDPGVNVTYLLAEGSPGPELLRLAEDNACDLIVVGSHGHTGLVRLLMGSVAEYLVRAANWPVLVVKRPTAPRHTDTQRRSQETEGKPERAAV